jgi:hypothetical protein
LCASLPQRAQDSSGGIPGHVATRHCFAGAAD